MTIRERLYRTDPYAGIDATKYPIDTTGWNPHDADFARLDVTGLTASLIIEVGTWKGASAFALAKTFPSAHIVCIDTWLGSSEMWEDHSDDTRYGDLKLEHGYPTVYRQFAANVINLGLCDRITPMPMPSHQALKLLRKWGVTADLIYLDGSHDGEDLLLDITLARNLYPLTLCGDDYSDDWPGVKWAVGHAFPSGVSRGENGFWSINL